MAAKPRLLSVIDLVALLMLAAAIYMVFVFAPIERVMGLVQKVFYFHVSAGWVGMLSYLVAAIAAVVYLVTRRRSWDTVSLAAVELGLVFMLINIITGSIWARPIWNTWWTWDPRLTTATIMELAYAGYLMLRGAVEDPERRSRFASVYAIIAFISVPLTYFSIRIFRTIHPVVIGNGAPGNEGSFDMTPAMLQTFMFSLLTFSVIYVSLLWHRIRLGRLADQVEELKMRYSD
ncbi:MAG: cytochrome c biogenesis protein CcsA [Anaerolineaceae bacterium]|jgi:heme exporter protein C